MKIGLIDVDYNGSFPNIAIMKISAYHKAQGDEVSWYSPIDGRYDRVYVSKVFSFTPDYDEVINADEVCRGGSGYAIRLVNGKEFYDKSKDHNLPSEIEHQYPDYSLYPELTKDTAYGFLSRGCPRGCDFCHVKDKEGRKAYKVANLSEWWNGQKNICLCDPNIIACRDWRDLLQQLADSKAWVDINQGIDVRILTEEKAKALGKLKLKEVHFAWDRYQDREEVLRGVDLFQKYVGIGSKSHNVICFTLVNFDTTIEQDLDRIYTLREHGVWAYVMIYDKEHCAHIYKRLQRWCNNRIIFARCERFDDYMSESKPKEDDRQLSLF